MTYFVVTSDARSYKHQHRLSFERAGYEKENIVYGFRIFRASYLVAALIITNLEELPVSAPLMRQGDVRVICV